METTKHVQHIIKPICCYLPTLFQYILYCSLGITVLPVLSSIAQYQQIYLVRVVLGYEFCGSLSEDVC